MNGPAALRADRWQPAIAFGDSKAGYLVNDYLGTRVLRDPFAIRLLRVAA